MNENRPSNVLERYSKVAVIGAGVIGASWTAVFLAHGLTVVVNDPRDDVEGVVNDYIRKASPTLKALGLPTDDLTRRLRFEADLDRAVAGVDLVQENGPERVEFKQDLWARIEQHVPPHALLLSSSSAKTATEQSLKMKNPSRLLIGHPFNPPHLIPLVEIVPGNKPSQPLLLTPLPFTKQLARSRAFFERKFRGSLPTGCSARFFASDAIWCSRVWLRWTYSTIS
jgi:ketoreductase RED1